MGKHFSFIHCADLHLGEPFAGTRYGSKGPWNEQIGRATFKAFEKVVDAALENRVDAILISGDIYNSDHHSLAAQMAFARELYRAAEEGISVYIVHGNHDPKEAWRAEIPLPSTVHVFSSEQVEGVPLIKNGEQLATIYGISYKTRHVEENLAKQFKKKEDDLFAIGMLHTDLGLSENHYAPCSVSDLIQSGMDYWALGHVHTRRTISTKPYILYPGNTQGMDISETGERGCYLVDVGAYGTVTTKFIETDVIRFMDMTVDITGMNDIEVLLREITKKRQGLKEVNQRPNIIRLILTGTGPLHKAISTEESKEYILQILNDKEQFRFLFAYFIRLVDETKPEMNLEERRELPDVTGSYLRAHYELAKLSLADRKSIFTKLLAEQPEIEKYKELLPYLSDDVLEKVFKRSEALGAEMLMKEGT